MVIAKNRFFGIFRLLVTLVSLASLAQAAAVEATLDRESASAGSGGVLSIRITGGSAEEPVMPEVQNFIIQPRGQSRQMQMTNGQTSVSLTYNYVVGSNTPGVYEIPRIEVVVDGKKTSTEPLTFTVLGSGFTPPATAPPQAGNEPPSEPPVADTEENRFGFLTVELAASERKHVYVGEIAPVRIQAWLPANSQAQLRSGIQPESKAYTLHHVSERPEQTQQVKDGKNYTVLTWFGGMSAAKAGSFPASLSVNATVAVRDPNAPKPTKRRRSGPFSDPFFDSVFEDMSVPMLQKDVTLKSVDQEIEVRPLPTDGRPTGFTGAVGQFKFERVDLPSTWSTGEPQQISARLSGSGNFSLLNAPALTPAESWKSYPGKDEFAPGDQASFSGTKSFQFTAVPRKGGAQEAALSFSYFDPAAEAYKTLMSEAKPLQVGGEDLVEAVAPPVAESAAKSPEIKPPSLAAQRVEMDAVVSLTPLMSNPLFPVLLGASAALGFLGQALSYLRKRRENPQRLARAALEAATREALVRAERCAAAGDAGGYLAAARQLLQHRLGALWGQSAQAITLAEIRARLPQDSPVTRFFIEADRYEYTRATGGNILPEWRALLEAALASLTPTAR
jgi:BatD DUF11 like domain